MKSKERDRGKGFWETMQTGGRGRGASAKTRPEAGGGGQCPGPRSHHLDDAPLHGGDRGSPGGAAALRGGGHV